MTENKVIVYDIIQVTQKELELCKDDMALKVLLEEKADLAIRSILKRLRDAKFWKVS